MFFACFFRGILSSAAICALAALSASSTCFSQSGQYPAWVENPPPRGYLLPANYSGTFPTAVKRQFPLHTQAARSSRVRIYYASHSGDVGVRDMRNAAVVRSSMSLGFDHVTSIRRVGAEDAVPTQFLVCGVSISANNSRLKLVTFPQTGPAQVTNIGLPSSAGGIWCAASPIGSSVYVYDAQASAVLRLTDANQDGLGDTVDSSFMVAVPQDVATDSVAVTVLPITGFSEMSAGKLDVWSRLDSKATLDLSLGSISVDEENGSGRSFAAIDNGVFASAKCVYVHGTPGLEFLVERTPQATGVPGAITSKWTIPASGWVVVDLTSLTQLGDVLRVKPADASVEVGTVAVKVTDRHDVSLYPNNRGRVIARGEAFDILGFGLAANHVVRYKTADGTTGVLTSKFKSSRKIVAKAPDFGTPVVTEPFPKATRIQIWITESGSGVRLSDFRIIAVHHH